MMRTFILLVFILLGGIAFSQDEDPIIKLDAAISNEDSGKKLAGVTMEVLRDGKPFLSESSASNGRFPITDLPVGSLYTIYFKKSGFVTKIAKVDGRYDYPEDLGLYTPLQFKAALFEEIEGVDFSFLESTPVIEFEMDAAGILAHDKKKLSTMLKKIEALKKQIEEKKEELEKEAKEQKKREADFNAYVKAGDGAMKKQDYEKAIGQYNLALEIKPDDKSTQDKLEDAKIRLEELNANAQSDKDFAAKMGEAKDAYGKEDLEKALGLYKEASAIKPDEKLPKDLISEIEGKIAEQQKNEKAFNDLVAVGDAAVNSESYDEGISKYEEALKLKSDSGVQAKLDDAKKKKSAKESELAAEKEKQQKYDNLIAKADTDLSSEKLEEAKRGYEEALVIKPEESKPKDKIAEIEKILKDRAAELAEKEKLESDYKRAMDEAKELFNQRDWEKSKSKYEEALKLKVNDSEALNQIDLIRKEIEKETSEAKENAAYDAFIKEGQALFDQKKYNEAKAEFNNALGIKPSEQTPKDKISEIEKLLADASKAEEQEKAYKDFMTAGNAANDNKEYNTAVEKYKKALEIKPNDADAQGKIDAINKIIAEENALAEEQKKFDDFIASAEQSFNAKDYDKAKLNYNNALDIRDDAGVKEKIKEIDALIAKNQSEAETQAKYDAVLKEADQLYQSNDNKAALEKFKEALSIKDEAYPKEKISELTEKIGKQEAEAEKEEKFLAFKEKADAAFEAKDYNAALINYKEAIGVKPDIAITQKIAELNTLIEQEGQNAEKQANYDAKIKEADAAFTDENWNGARTLYEDAGRILPTETYPEERINEIAAKMEAESLAETEKQYQKIISKADGLLNEEKYDDALSYYERALGLKPSDNYPKDQIDKINTIKKEKADALSQAEDLNRRYDALIAEADESFNAQNWPVALEKYKGALELKPSESYPVNRIAEIKTKLSELEKVGALDEEYNAFIKQADELFNQQEYIEAKKIYEKALDVKPKEQYPKDKIASADTFLKQETLNEEARVYQKILDVAQRKFDEKNYEKALELYLRAKTTKPSDPIPQQRIDEINQIISKLGADKKQEEEYDSHIKDGDYQFEKGNWKAARNSYIKAFNIFNREYPEKKIVECDKFLEKEGNNQANKSYNKLIKKADEYLTKANYPKAKDLFTRALGLKPSDQYPKDKLEEIEKLLNPEKFAKSKGPLKDYGDPNRSVNAIDIDAMLANAEAQRKFLTAQKVEQQGIDAVEANKENDLTQTDNNFDVRNEVLTVKEDIRTADDAAVEAGVQASWKVEGIQSELVVEERGRVDQNDNDVQLQNQIVDNINTEIIERDEEDDLPREAYILDVEEIRSELIVENTSYEVLQTNETFVQKDYVEESKENRIEDDVNRDIPRKNGEIRIEDYNIQLINESNENTWDQEDVVIEVKDNTEVQLDERIANEISNDIPRVEVINDIEEVNLERIHISSDFTDRQYDVTIDQKKYTEKEITEIDLANLNNDIPRERMEGFVENQDVDNKQVLEELSLDQDNVLFTSDTKVEELEIKINENKDEDDKNREGYEDVVDNIKESESDYIAEKSAINENESHETVDYLENESAEKRDKDEDANEAADENIDNTQDSIDEMTDEVRELDEKSKVDLENSEDFVESLRDIKVNEITEKMKNDLGSQFPEGVTEEIYTIDDENGLIVSYIVRRIVVVNGVGNVYEKVQTKFGTTSYSVNGAGISEFDWQDQTEAGDLVRN